MRRIASTLLFLVPIAAIESQTVPSPAYADHCEPELCAAGASEAQLAGIRFPVGDVGAALAPLGKANRAVVTLDGSGASQAPPRETHWTKGRTEITVGTATSMPPGGVETTRIESVRVTRSDLAQPAGGTEFPTGKGIALGARLSDVVAAYGTTYSAASVFGRMRIVYCWSDETSLSFDFDADGKVQSIALVGPVARP